MRGRAAEMTLIKVDAFDHLGTVEIESGFPLVDRPGEDIPFSLHLPWRLFIL